jgi:hypothetical protein
MNDTRLEAARREVATVIDPIAHMKEKFDRLKSGDAHDIVALYHQLDALLERAQSDMRLRLAYGASVAPRLLALLRRFFTTAHAQLGAANVLRAMKRLDMPAESIASFRDRTEKRGAARRDAA